MKAIADNSLRTYLGALVSLFKRGEEAGWFKRSDASVAELQGYWVEKLHQSSRRYNNRIDENVESERERESRTTMQDWMHAYRTAKHENPYDPVTLLLAFHALVRPPLRGGDLARVHIGYTSTGNCIFRDPDNGGQIILLIRDHKTSKSYGPLERVLKGEIVDLLREGNKQRPREWLFATQSGAPYSDSGFSTWKANALHDVFGRPVTTNSLRHAFISEMDRQNQSTSEARSVARQMGHGLATQRSYVRFHGDERG